MANLKNINFITMNRLIATFLALVFLFSCGVPKEQFAALQNEHQKTLEELAKAKQSLAELKVESGSLKDKVAYLVKGNEDKLEQLGNYAVLSKTAAENMNNTLKQLSEKDAYIQRLREASTRIDSLNLAVAANLKSVLQNGLNDEDIQVKVEKTVVYISIADKLLFKSGSYKVSKRSTDILSKVADVVNARPDLNVMVEGHTDDKMIIAPKALMNDNWDLSVSRAAAIVRILQNKFNVAPERLIAAGRSKYIPLVENDSKENRARNRRTKIIILPKLEEFFKLLESK